MQRVYNTQWRSKTRFLLNEGKKKQKEIQRNDIERAQFTKLEQLSSMEDLFR